MSTNNFSRVLPIDGTLADITIPGQSRSGSNEGVFDTKYLKNFFGMVLFLSRRYSQHILSFTNRVKRWINFNRFQAKFEESVPKFYLGLSY